MKKIFTLLTLAAALAASGAYAQSVEGEASVGARIAPPPRPGATSTRPEAQIRAEVRANAADLARPELRESIEARRMGIASTTASSAEARRNMAASSTLERREQFASSTEARRERVAGTLAEHLTLSIERASKMLNNIYERLLIIKDKIQSRIVKLEEGGADMSGARARLGESEDLFVTAKASIEAVAKVEVDSSNVEASREAIKEAVRSAKEAIQKAHQSLSPIIQAMKASSEANAETRTEAEVQ